MVKKLKAYRKSKRKEQVVLQLQIWQQNGYATEATTYKLARALGITPQHRFRELLNEMVEEGVLARELRPQPGRVDTYFYSLVADASLITEKYSRRVIVKQRGKITGQLELAL